MASVGDRLREIREAKALSQRGLAELTDGVHFNTVTGIESGKHKPRPSTIRKLAEALQVPVEYLTGGPRQEVLRPTMADFLHSLDLEPEDFFVNVEIPSDEVRKLYEAAYARLLQGEKNGSIVPFLVFEDEERSYTLDFMRAVKALPPGDQKAQLLERATAMARREAALWRQEAERRERELLEMGQGLAGVA